MFRCPTAHLLAGKGHSAQWVQRHVKDKYVQKAKQDQYRSRAAYKLQELDSKFKFLQRRGIIVDLGCFAGSWSQVALERTGVSLGKPGLVIGVDKVQMVPLEYHCFVQGDIRESSTLSKVQQQLGDKRADVVLADLAPKMIGSKTDDHINSVELCRSALAFCKAVLGRGGWFVTKVFDGHLKGTLQLELEQLFEKVRPAKPAACRPESRELYLVCSKFLGPAALDHSYEGLNRPSASTGPVV
mmetsp:Transcript_60603/g.131366  ORF Transcript_60603/g.131366 Transcript_60603/m.131366 type:complete len:242 (-) Transcript_60603:96-821(-)